MSRYAEIRDLCYARNGGRPLPRDPAAYGSMCFVSGEDIIVPYTLATCFGGSHDPGDDGATASGIRTDRPGGVAGCALPMPLLRACDGTPFPVLPWGTIVEVCTPSHHAHVPLIDVGPSRAQHPCRMIDLTELAVSFLVDQPIQEHWTQSWGEYVAFRVIGVAQHLRDYFPRNASGPGTSAGRSPS